MVAGIVFLKVTGISYENYKIGGDIINFFLEPATISFAIPLYKNVMYLKILATNFWGYRYWNVNRTYLNLLSSYCIPIRRSNWCFNATTSCYNCDRPSSITGIGGVKELTSLAVILNAVVISALGTKIVKWFKISNPIARGLALVQVDTHLA